MTTRYAIVRARSAAEAKEKCSFKAGDTVVIKEVEASSNNDGTWSMFPIIELPPQPDSKRSTNESGK